MRMLNPKATEICMGSHSRLESAGGSKSINYGVKIIVILITFMLPSSSSSRPTASFAAAGTSFAPGVKK